MNVLIVDDSEASLQYLRRVVVACGHTVVGEARDGAGAVRQYGALRPDVVVMDLIMPTMNGLEALREIRDADPAARVVLASSAQSSDAALEAEQLGARFFLYKPIEQEQLAHVLDVLAGAQDGQAD
jgi:two-component system chemotaxis response regulator CheY